MDFIRKFDIELDRELYYAGEILSGRIIVQNTENIRVQGIRLHLRGKAHAEWRITRAGERRTVKQDEHYIDERKSVWGKDRNEEGPIPILPRGNHKYPFEFKLPESALPCSFESKIGTIRYYIRVTIDIPYASCPQGIKYFTVVGPHIDCMDERFLTPTHAETKRYNCSLCCGKGPLWMKGTLERTAYCCGENVKLKVEIQNGCDEEVWLMVRMMQYVEYFINRGVLGLSKELRHTVIQMESPHIEPHTTTTLDDLHHQLQVPIMPPTMVDVCGLVQIYYSLRICLRMEKSGDALEAEMPVTIATVPFRIPSNPNPEIQYDVAADYVEGGMYISSEFQLGQVYMGDEEDSDTDKEILYRPVYMCVPHKRPTPRHKMKAAADNKRSVSSTSMDKLLSPASAESGLTASQEDGPEQDKDESVQIDNDVVRLQIIREDNVPEEKSSDSIPIPAPRKLRDDIPEEGIKLPILICRDPVPKDKASVPKETFTTSVSKTSEDINVSEKSAALSEKDDKCVSRDKVEVNVPKTKEGTSVTIIKPVPFAKVESNALKDIPKPSAPPKDSRSGGISTAKTSTTFRQVHETASSVVVKTIETVKVKDVVVSQNESEDRQFEVTKSEQTQKEVSTEKSKVTPSGQTEKEVITERSQVNPSEQTKKEVITERSQVTSSGQIKKEMNTERSQVTPSGQAQKEVMTERSPVTPSGVEMAEKV